MERLKFWVMGPVRLQRKIRMVNSVFISKHLQLFGSNIFANIYYLFFWIFTCKIIRSFFIPYKFFIISPSSHSSILKSLLKSHMEE